MQYAEPADIVKNCPMNNIFLVALITHEDLMKNLKSGHDIGGGGENRLTIFRLNFAWFSTCLKFSSNTWKSRKDCICFFAALPRAMRHFGKVYNENAADDI